MRFWAIVFGLFVLAVPAFADDVDGKWSGSVSTPNGDFPVAFTFKADGEKLTGSMAGPDGSQFPVQDGKVAGSNISFSVTLDFGGNSFTVSYQGIVSTDQIKMSAAVNGQVLEFVVKKED